MNYLPVFINNLAILRKIQNMSMGEFEIIERKGIGHPDTVCDILSANTISSYITALSAEMGGVPNGWFDKVAISGGEAEIGFGESKIVKLPGIYLFGKAMAVDGNLSYVDELFANEVDEALRSIYGDAYNPEVHAPRIITDVNSGIGAEHDKSFYTRSNSVNTWDHRLSNDTVACAGWYPFSDSELLTVSLENFINGDVFKAQFPETGADVKVMTRRSGDQTDITICVPFIADRTPSEEFYEARKKEIVDYLTAVTEQTVPGVNIVINTKDVPGKGYLTVFGSAFDKGDCGMTGRGNKFPGVISVMRPSGVEAFSGKNPKNHTGRMYGTLTFEISRMLHQQTGNSYTTVITANNGDSVEAPSGVYISENDRPVNVKDFRPVIDKAIDKVCAEEVIIGSADGLNNFRSGYGFFF
jgi:S-adenosylmethionine synthetase